MTFALKRLTKSEKTKHSISMALISLVLITAAAVYYTSLQPDTLEADRILLSYVQHGVFDYTTYLKPNAVYNGVTELGPRESYFAALVESMSVAYSYEFTLQDAAGAPVALPPDARVEYEVAAILGEAEFWEREYLLTLRQPTTSGTEVNTHFRIPIQAYQAEAEAVRVEVNTPGRDVQMRIEVRVWPLIATEVGTINTPFVHTLTLHWTETELNVEGARRISESGSLTEPSSIVDPQRIFYQRLAIGGLLSSVMLLLGWLGVSFWASRVSFTPEEMHLEIQRRYGEVIVAALALPAPGPRQVVVPLQTFADIGRAAHELMRPIITVVEPDGRRYVVIDGGDSVRYEYWLANNIATTGSPDKRSNLADPEERGVPLASHRNGRSANREARAAPREAYLERPKNGTHRIHDGVAQLSPVKPGSPPRDVGKTDAHQEESQ